MWGNDGVPYNDNNCDGAYGSYAELIGIYLQMGTTTHRSGEFSTTVYEKTLITDDNNNSIPKQQTKEMTKMLSACDKNMLYYKWRCELDSSKFFCSNSALDGYLILRGIENTERPTVFTKA
jgi:hypothetical protein